MARFEQTHIDEIRDRIDLVNFIGRYVQLKSSGRNHIGLCPFHQEKTPSFHVHRERKFFHCFGCQENGDVFAFVMKYDGLTFPEAVERLAAEAGVTLPKHGNVKGLKEKRRKESLYYRAYELATRFYNHTLTTPQAKQAITYIRQRGMQRAMIERFHIGFAPARWDGLLRYLEKQGLKQADIVRVGLAVQRDDRKPYDMFRNRLMFPITDGRGRVVGFGGRALQDVEPKYINTPQTELFSKREHLYGLAQARPSARRAGFVIVCEGYTDVIALAQHGVENAVASLGTAFTEEQAALLRRISDEVILAFDADGAGRAATERGLDVLQDAGLGVRVTMLPEGLDPDAFLQSHGIEALQQLFDNALPLTEYRIEMALQSADMYSVEGRAKAVEQIVPILAQVPSAVAQEGYIEKIAREIGSSVRAVEAELARFRQRGAGRTNIRHRNAASRYTTKDALRQRKPAPQPPSPPQPNLKNVLGFSQPEVDSNIGEQAIDLLDERVVLWILNKEPAHIDKVYTILGEKPFRLKLHNELFAAMRGQLLDGAEGGTHNSPPHIVAAVNDLKSWEPSVVLDLEHYIDRLWERQMRRNLRRLEARLTRLPERDEYAYAEHVGSLLLCYKRFRQAIREYRATS